MEKVKLGVSVAFKGVEFKHDLYFVLRPDFSEIYAPGSDPGCHSTQTMRLRHTVYFMMLSMCCYLLDSLRQPLLLHYIKFCGSIT